MLELVMEQMMNSDFISFFVREKTAGAIGDAHTVGRLLWIKLDTNGFNPLVL